MPPGSSSYILTLLSGAGGKGTVDIDAAVTLKAPASPPAAPDSSIWAAIARRTARPAQFVRFAAVSCACLKAAMLASFAGEAKTSFVVSPSISPSVSLKLLLLLLKKERSFSSSSSRTIEVPVLCLCSASDSFSPCLSFWASPSSQPTSSSDSSAASACTFAALDLEAICGLEWKAPRLAPTPVSPSSHSTSSSESSVGAVSFPGVCF
mmetsp:Transcript_34122/g.73972  ORF Transcript_34122/g.73972 Transcript_34122/m.73972 type:complete len:208 (-) Transcript_34122:238-861(-)